MTKIVLTDVIDAYDISAMNANFTALETELNDKVLYRNSPTGEPNSMSSDLDMNGKRIYNIPAPALPSEPARLQDIQNATNGITTANLITVSPVINMPATNVQQALEDLTVYAHSAAGYVLPTATPTVLGGVKVGSGLAIDGAGVLTAGGAATANVSSLTGLRALLKTGPSLAYVSGHTTQGDGFAGFYRYDSTDTTSTDNGGMTIVATDGGRWKKVSQGKRGSFFTQNGAVVERMADRFLLGDAVVNDATYPNVTKDWLSTFQTAAGLPTGALVSAQGAVLAGLVDSSTTAWLTGSQSLNATSAGASTIGEQAYVINNHPSLSTNAWAFYGEAHRTVATTNQVVGMELDTRTLFDTTASDPYAQGLTIGLQLASGCELPGTQYDASAAIQIWNNPKKFKTGIVFGASSITGTDGTGSGSGVAIACAQGHAFVWYNSARQQTSSVVGNCATATTAMKMIFDDSGINFADRNNKVNVQIPYVANAVNYPALYGGGTGGPIGLSAVGTDANIVFNVDSKGSGDLVLGHTGMYLKFGDYNAGVTSITGYVTIRDMSGTLRKLAVIA